MHEEIKKFLNENILLNKSVEIGYDTSLILSGLIDSFSVLDIMQFAEESFGVLIPDEKVTRADFDTINLIVKTVIRFKK